MVNSHIIYLIGFMGSGKSTAGKELASLLGWSFADLDSKIEEHTGKTIPEIFSQNGEDYFRIVESELLKDFKAESNSVISTGGGTPCYSDNMDYMLKTGLTIYLKMTPEQLKRRLSGSNAERPLIKDIDTLRLQSFIEEKLSDREKWYDRSIITVKGNDLDINELHLLVKSRLRI